jgi:formate hydrogenlyase subunit 4
VTVGLIAYVVKLLLLACVVALVETSNAKLRLFRVPELLSIGFILAALALASSFIF